MVDLLTAVRQLQELQETIRHAKPGYVSATERAMAELVGPLIEDWERRGKIEEAARQYRQTQGDIDAAQGARAPMEDLNVALGYAAFDLDAALALPGGEE